MEKRLREIIMKRLAGFSPCHAVSYRTAVIEVCSVICLETRILYCRKERKRRKTEVAAAAPKKLGLAARARELSAQRASAQRAAAEQRARDIAEGSEG